MTDKQETRGTAFVEALLSICSENNGLSAAMRRAANPATEFQCWPLMVRLGVNIENASERKAFACIGSALVKGHIDKNGSLAFTRALCKSYEPESKQAEAKLRRLIACDSVESCCLVLRALLSLVQSKCSATVDYAALLDDLLKFRWDPERIRAKWTAEFYRDEK